MGATSSKEAPQIGNAKQDEPDFVMDAIPLSAVADEVKQDESDVVIDGLHSSADIIDSEDDSEDDDIPAEELEPGAAVRQGEPDHPLADDVNELCHLEPGAVPAGSLDMPDGKDRSDVGEAGHPVIAQHGYIVFDGDDHKAKLVPFDIVSACENIVKNKINKECVIDRDDAWFILRATHYNGPVRRGSFEIPIDGVVSMYAGLCGIQCALCVRTMANIVSKYMILHHLGPYDYSLQLQEQIMKQNLRDPQFGAVKGCIFYRPRDQNQNGGNLPMFGPNGTLVSIPN